MDYFGLSASRLSEKKCVGSIAQQSAEFSWLRRTLLKPRLRVCHQPSLISSTAALNISALATELDFQGDPILPVMADVDNIEGRSMPSFKVVTDAA